MCKIINVNFPFVHGQKSSKGVSQFNYESRRKNQGVFKMKVPDEIEKIEIVFNNQREFKRLWNYSMLINNYPDIYYRNVG
jgi:hypothetical protein